MGPGARIDAAEYARRGFARKATSWRDVAESPALGLLSPRRDHNGGPQLVGKRRGSFMGASGARQRGKAMIESKERKPYWRHTKWQMLASLAPFVVAMIVLPIYADRLNSNKFLGFPLGYFLALHGLILIAIVTVSSFVNRQDAIDHWHGAHEDL